MGPRPACHRCCHEFSDLDTARLIYKITNKKQSGGEPCTRNPSDPPSPARPAHPLPTRWPARQYFDAHNNGATTVRGLPSLLLRRLYVWDGGFCLLRGRGEPWRTTSTRGLTPTEENPIPHSRFEHHPATTTTTTTPASWRLTQFVLQTYPQPTTYAPTATDNSNPAAEAPRHGAGDVGSGHHRRRCTDGRHCQEQPPAGGRGAAGPEREC